MADVVLKTKDGAELPAHRQFLERRCSVVLRGASLRRGQARLESSEDKCVIEMPASQAATVAFLAGVYAGPTGAAGQILLLAALTPLGPDIIMHVAGQQP